MLPLLSTNRINELRMAAGLLLARCQIRAKSVPAHKPFLVITTADESDFLSMVLVYLALDL
jgi:hypothetical protein